MAEIRRNSPEILAPAGDRERLEAALFYGADAVYLAGKAYGAAILMKKVWRLRCAWRMRTEAGYT